MAVVSLGLDIQDVLSKTQQFVNALGTQQAAIENVVVSMVKYNKAKDQYTATLTGGIKGTQEQFTATYQTDLYKKDKQGAIYLAQAAGITGYQLTDTAQKQAAAAARALAQSNAQAARAIRETARKDREQDAAEALAHSSSLAGKIQATIARAFSIAQAQLIKQSFNAILQSIKEGVSEAVQYEEKISEIRTISQDSGQTFNQMAQSVRNVSDAFGIPQLDVAEATYQAISNQIVKAGKSEEFMAQEAQFALITHMKLTDAVNLTSSALNSYGLSASHTEEVNAQLFKTIELGRIRGENIANTFGRVAQMGHAVGVTLPEIGAALTVITNSGVRESEAMTLVTNVMQSLLHPSQQMKTVLESWGTPTGEAAVATFTFAGVLKKLQEAAQGGATEISELFKNIRSGRGAFALSDTDAYTKALNEIKGASTSAYENAKKIVAESPGRQLVKEFTQVKNFFVDDFGRPLLKGIVDLSGYLGGLSNLMITGTKVVLGLTAAYLAYRSAMFVLTSGVVNYIGVMSRWNVVADANRMVMINSTGATNAAVGSWKGLGAAALGAIGPIAAITAGVVALQYAFSDTNIAALKSSEYIKALSEKNIKATPTFKYNEIEADVNAFKASVDTIFIAVNQTLAQAYRISVQRLQDLRREAKFFGEDLANAFQIGMDRFRGALRDSEREITDARTQIREIIRGQETETERTEELILRQALAFATPNEQAVILNRRLQDVIGRMEELGQKAQDVNLPVTERTGFLNRMKEQANNAMQLRVELENLRKTLAQQAGFTGAIGLDPRFRTDIEDIGNRRVEIENRVVASLQRTIEKYTELSEVQKKQVRDLEKAAKDYFDLTKGLETGDIFKKTEYQSPGGKANVQKVLDDIEDARKRLLALAGADADKLVEFYKKSEEYKTLATKLGAATRSQIEIEAAQNTAKVTAEELKKAYETASTAQKETQKDIFDPKTGGITKATEGLAELSNMFNAFRTSLYGFDLPKLYAIFNVTTSDKAEEYRQTGLQSIQDLMKGLQSLRDAQKNIDSPEQAETFRQRLVDYKQNLVSVSVSLTNFISTWKGQKVDLNQILVPGSDNVTVGNVLKQVSDDVDSMSESLAKYAQAKERAAALKGNLSDLVGGLPQEAQYTLDKFLRTGKDIEVKIPQNFTFVNNALRETMGVVEELRKSMEEKLTKPIGIPIQLIAPKQAPPINLPQADNQWEDIPGFAGGGWIPRGKDRILGWFQGGEMIMNPAATQAFYSQLQAMNSAVRPGYYANGGYVTTNVGDIHLNMTTTGNAETDVRRFGSLLRREIRRGTVRLY
jgi:TP901 family phage tail tape measure protein